jgi:hypothetical protein
MRSSTQCIPIFCHFLVSVRMRQSAIEWISMVSVVQLLRLGNPQMLKEFMNWIWCYFGCERKFAGLLMSVLLRYPYWISGRILPHFFLMLSKALVNAPMMLADVMNQVPVLLRRSGDLEGTYPGFLPTVSTFVMQLGCISTPEHCAKAAFAFVH